MNREIFPNDDESIVAESKVSKAAIAVFCLSVPVYIIFLYYPIIHNGLLRFIWTFIPEIKTPQVLLSTCIAVLLLVIWSGICLVKISKMNGRLILTDQRILGQQGNHTLSEPIDKVIDVRLQQSLWGKVFHYGTLSVVTDGRNLTIESLHDAVTLRRQILNAAQVQYYDD